MGLPTDHTVTRTPLLKHVVNVGTEFPLIPPGARANLSFDFYKDLARNKMLATLQTYLLESTHKEYKTLQVRTPETWWDHFKESRFPTWLLRRYPAKYTLKSFSYPSEVRICPHGDFAWDNRSHIEFLRYEDVSSLADTPLSEEWWQRFNEAILSFDEKYWGHDLTVAVFDVIKRAGAAETRVIELERLLEGARSSTKMWRDAAQEKRS